MSTMLTELAPRVSFFTELREATSGPAMRDRARASTPANDASADLGWLNAPRDEDPSRPLASYDSRLDPPSDAEPAEGPRGRRFGEAVRAIARNVDTAFIVVVLAAELAVGAYTGAQAVESLWIAPAAATQIAQP